MSALEVSKSSQGGGGYEFFSRVDRVKRVFSESKFLDFEVLKEALDLPAHTIRELLLGRGAHPGGPQRSKPRKALWSD